MNEIFTRWLTRPKRLALLLCSFLLTAVLTKLILDTAIRALHPGVVGVWIELARSVIIYVLAILVYRVIRAAQIRSGIPVPQGLDWKTGFAFWALLILAILLYLSYCHANHETLRASLLNAFYSIMDAVEYALFILLLLSVAPNRPGRYRAMLLPLLIFCVPFTRTPVGRLILHGYYKAGPVGFLLYYTDNVMLMLLYISVIVYACERYSNQLLRSLAFALAIYPLLDTVSSAVAAHISDSQELIYFVYHILSCLTAIAVLQLMTWRRMRKRYASRNREVKSESI